jgi:murein DD-endopeptidase MepM/ murein hydrolase activator NlpD
MATEPTLREEITEFGRQLGVYLGKRGRHIFQLFEAGKDVVTGALYHKRGKYAQPFLHSTMMAFMFFGVAFGPQLVSDTFAEGQKVDVGRGTVLGETSLAETGLVTMESNKPRGSIEEYVVKDGDTLSELAAKFDVSAESIKWANEVIDFKKMKPGMIIKIPPVTGIVYKVKPGDTIYSIAKKFEANAQGIVDFPFNTFSNDETFAIIAGQTLIVPDGVMPDAPAPVVARFANVLTPDAGSVTAMGSFVWPAFGRITQEFKWYHPGVDIANHDGGAILAADSGTVITAGWSTVGYGNYVIIEHGNGYKTLYGHMSVLSVVVGQRVARGSVIGQMGSTGRSTGTHLHFEVVQNGVKVNPLSFLK